VAAKFVLRKDPTGKYRFALIAPNGHVIAASLTYESRPGALNGIRSVKRNAPNAEIEEQTGSMQMHEVVPVDDDGKTRGRLPRLLDRGRIALISLISILVGAYIPALTNYSLPGAVQKIRGDPPVVATVGYDSDVYPDGFEMALPGPLDDAGQAPNTMTCAGVHGWLASRDAVDIDNTFLKLLVTGARDQGVSITSMHARIKKRESSPVHGTYVDCPSGGEVTSARVMFDLDSSDPRALLDKDNEQSPSQPYFKGNSVRLEKNTALLFEVRATTQKCYCSWTIVLTVLADKKEQEVEVLNHSEPFKTTARAPTYGARYDWMGGFVPITAP
jgi:uncharacterized protein YegP (UPF0339 family)